MKRKDIKRMERELKKNDATICMKQSDLDRIIFETKRQTQSQVIKTFSYAVTMALNNEFGFGKERMARFFERTNVQFECILAETITINEIYDWCQERGIDIENWLAADRKSSTRAVGL
jgi:hypothetical protein